MNLVNQEDKVIRERKATKDLRGKLELKDYQVQVDQEASQE